MKFRVEACASAFNLGFYCLSKYTQSLIKGIFRNEYVAVKKDFAGLVLVFLLQNKKKTLRETIRVSKFGFR